MEIAKREANSYGRANFVRICTKLDAIQNGTTFKQSARKMALKWMDTQSLVKVFLNELESVDREDARITMATLKRVMINLMKKKYPFSMDMFNLLVIHEERERVCASISFHTYTYIHAWT